MSFEVSARQPSRLPEASVKPDSSTPLGTTRAARVNSPVFSKTAPNSATIVAEPGVQRPGRTRLASSFSYASVTASHE